MAAARCLQDSGSFHLSALPSLVYEFHQQDHFVIRDGHCSSKPSRWQAGRSRGGRAPQFLSALYTPLILFFSWKSLTHIDILLAVPYPKEGQEMLSLIHSAQLKSRESYCYRRSGNGSLVNSQQWFPQSVVIHYVLMKISLSYPLKKEYRLDDGFLIGANHLCRSSLLTLVQLLLGTVILEAPVCPFASHHPRDRSELSC